MKTKEDYKNEFWNQIISDVSYNYYDDFGEDYEEQINEWAESYANRRMKENKEINEKLTKYKRAFEILKDKGVCILNEKLYVDFEEYDENDLGFETGYYSYLTKEEYELLEELMKSE